MRQGAFALCIWTAPEARMHVASTQAESYCAEFAVPPLGPTCLGLGNLTNHSHGRWLVREITAREGGTPFSAGRWTQGEVLRGGHKAVSSTCAICIGDHQIPANASTSYV